MPVRAPPPVAGFTEVEKKLNGAWGSKLCCEAPYGVQETRARIKVDVTPKIGAGGGWAKTVMTEKAESVSKSAMYSGSQIEMSCCQAADKVRLRTKLEAGLARGSSIDGRRTARASLAAPVASARGLLLYLTALTVCRRCRAGCRKHQDGPLSGG